MKNTNHELKARSSEKQQDEIREYLREKSAKFMEIEAISKNGSLSGKKIKATM